MEEEAMLSQKWLEKHVGGLPQCEIGIGGFRKEFLKDASYTFTLSPHVRVLAPDAVLDTRHPAFPKCASVRMDEREGYILQPGGFVLCTADEELSLSLGIACLISTHPSAATFGIDFLQTSTLVPPGSRCYLTLETRNNGPCPVRLYPGMKAVKGIFLSCR